MDIEQRGEIALRYLKTIGFKELFGERVPRSTGLRKYVRRIAKLEGLDTKDAFEFISSGLLANGWYETEVLPLAQQHEIALGVVEYFLRQAGIRFTEFDRERTKHMGEQAGVPEDEWLLFVRDMFKKVFDTALRPESRHTSPEHPLATRKVEAILPLFTNAIRGKDGRFKPSGRARARIRTLARQYNVRFDDVLALLREDMNKRIDNHFALSQ